MGVRTHLRSWHQESRQDGVEAKIARLETELDTYRHAFETTVTDRDRWKAIAETNDADARTDHDQVPTTTAYAAGEGAPMGSRPAPAPLAPIDLGVQHSLARRLDLLQRADHYFFVDVVGTCNLRCPSCAVGNSNPAFAKGLMSPDAFDRILSKIAVDYADCGRVFIDLYNWGEPALHPELGSLIRIARRYGFGVGISSNLNVFPTLRDTVKAGPDYLRISYSGMRPETYGLTHRGGNVFALKSNMYKLRELLDRYRSNTIVQCGFHIYRSNFPDDFFAARALADELGFLFSPVIATIMPAEKAVEFALADTQDLEQDLLDRLVIPVRQTLEIHAEAGPPTADCQFRQARTTINYDGSVMLCCATYEPDKLIAHDFLELSRHDLEAAKYGHQFCESCMTSNVNKIYTGFDTALKNKQAVSVLGPLFQTYLGETAHLGSTEHVVFENRFVPKLDIYRRGLAALSAGDDASEQAELLFEALVSGAPDFAEGLYQTASIAFRRENRGRALKLAREACELDPDNDAYRQLLETIEHADSEITQPPHPAPLTGSG